MISKQELVWWCSFVCFGLVFLIFCFSLLVLPFREHLDVRNSLQINVGLRDWDFCFAVNPVAKNNGSYRRGIGHSLPSCTRVKIKTHSYTGKQRYAQQTRTAAKVILVQSCNLFCPTNTLESSCHPWAGILALKTRKALDLLTAFFAEQRLIVTIFKSHFF